MADGLDTYAVAIGVKQNTAAGVRADIVLLRAKELEYNTCKASTAVAEAATAAADEAGKLFILAASATQRIRLGTKWSRAWEPAQK